MRTFVNYGVHDELRATKTLVHISRTFRSKEAKKKVLKNDQGGGEEAKRTGHFGRRTLYYIMNDIKYEQLNISIL